MTGLASHLAGPVAVIAVGAYGRRELTPAADVEVLFVHTGDLSVPDVTRLICYPLWAQGIHIEPLLRSVEEFARDLRRSWSAASRMLDARLVVGDEKLFEALTGHVEPLRRDLDGLRRRVRADTAHRHATHPSVTASTGPDLVSGRGGLLDIQALRWLELADDARTRAGLDFLLGTLTAAEDFTQHAVQRLTTRLLDRLDPAGRMLPELYAHARWIAYRLDGALATPQPDRPLAAGLALQRGELIATRPPPLERVPALGLRIANLVGLAPPSADLFEWASRAGPPLDWDASSAEHLWLLLRAADWRAWDFLQVTGLLLRYFPELEAIHLQPADASALDTHSFFALRELHEWTDSEDALAARAWRAAGERDAVYLATVLHELTPESAGAIAQRIGLPAALVDAITYAVATYQSLLDTASRRDLHDEDLVLEFASRVGTRQRLGMLFLVAIAHDLAVGPGAWSAWKSNLVRQLFASLETALRSPAEVGARRTRALEQRRTQILTALERMNLYRLAPEVNRLPRRYVMSRSPGMAARHLSLLARGPLTEGEVRIRATRQRSTPLVDLLVVARDRPGLLATMSGILALRGASVLGADAATSSDGLVLDVFTVSGAEGLDWSRVEEDIRLAALGKLPLHDLLGSRPMPPEEAALVSVSIDNTASQFFSVAEVRAPDQVGLLYRIASALHAEGLDIHHARIATHPDGALDVFYVRTLDGAKLADDDLSRLSVSLAQRLAGDFKGDSVPFDPRREKQPPSP